MLKKVILCVATACACCASGAVAQEPVYKLLYSPPLGSNIGGLYGIFEGKPGLFFILSTWTGGATGASIFSVSGDGAFSPVYAFPPSSQTAEFVQATNGEVFGGAFTNTKPYLNFYYSVGLLGKNLQEYQFPAPWGPGFNTTVAPPNNLYDIVAKVVNSQTVYAFARVTESGQIAILHQFSGNDGVPDGFSAGLILAPDGNIYGIGAQQEHGISPMFIYRLSPSGTYSQLLTFPKVPGYDAFPLVAATDGYLYGTFSKGGTNDKGLIYRATLSGGYRDFASFPATISSPRTLMQAADGNLYGTTVYNQIFRYNFATQAVELCTRWTWLDRRVTAPVSWWRAWMASCTEWLKTAATTQGWEQCSA